MVMTKAPIGLFSVTCHWSQCRIVNKSALRDLMQSTCANGVCSHSVHAACLAVILKTYQVPQEFNKAVCSRHCYDAIQKQVREASASASSASLSQNRTNQALQQGTSSGGPATEDTPLSVLLDWLTTERNYARYTSSAAKDDLVEEIVREIAVRGITTTRSPEEISEMIHLLEKSYMSARDWLKATLHESMSEQARKAGVLARCFHFDRLKLVMEHGLRAKLSATQSNKPQTRRVSVETSGEGRTDASGETTTTAAIVTQPQRPSKKQRTAKATPSDVTSSSPTPAARLASLEVQETEARIEESKAHAAKLRQEERFMGLQATVMLLRERIKLREEGVAQIEIDLLLPLYSDPRL